MPYFFLLGAAIFIYLLYRQGLVISKSIIAVLFVFRPGRRQDRAKLDACTGWVRHAVHIREDRIYAFNLNCRLTKGSAEVIILDKEGQLLRLSPDVPSGKIELNRNSKYYLRWEVANCAGKNGTVILDGAFFIEEIKKQSRLSKQPALCWRHLSSRAVASQVLWAETSLTTVFGMGTGGPSF